MEVRKAEVLLYLCTYYGVLIDSNVHLSATQDMHSIASDASQFAVVAIVFAVTVISMTTHIHTHIATITTREMLSVLSLVIMS